METLKDLTKRYITDQRIQQALVRFGVSHETENSFFMEEIYMDIMSIGQNVELHIVDTATTFSAARLMPDSIRTSVWAAILEHCEGMNTGQTKKTHAA